jgi:hypothetical protein
MTDDEIRNIANANTIEYDSEDGESSFSLNIFDFARALLAASSAATVSDAASVPSDKTLRTLVLQIADMKPQYEENVVAGMNLLRNAFAATTAGAQDERAHPFAAVCDLLPSEVSWGDSLTPGIVRHIARAASSATAPLTSDSDALTADDADMVWPDDDDESMFHSIDDAVDYVVDLNWPDAEPLEITLQIAKRIPSATVRIFNITENGHEWEIVTDAARAQSTNGEQS